MTMTQVLRLVAELTEHTRPVTLTVARDHILITSAPPKVLHRLIAANTNMWRLSINDGRLHILTTREKGHPMSTVTFTASATVQVDLTQWVAEYGCAGRAEAVGQIITDLHQTLTELVTTAKWDGLATVSTIDIAAITGTTAVRGTS